MAGLLSALGGALEGVGQGMVESGRAKREAALEDLRHQRDLERDDRQYGRQVEREDLGYQREMARDEQKYERDLEADERDYRQRRGLLGYEHELGQQSDTAAYERDVKMAKLEAELKGTTTTGGEGGGTGAEGAPGFAMSAEEKRVYDEVKARYTDEMTKKVDWAAMTAHLRDMPAERGGQRWGEIADYLSGGVGARMTAEEALDAAKREADQKDSIWTSKATAFPETNGDKEKWIEQRAMELHGATDQGTGRDKVRQVDSLDGAAAEDARPFRAGEFVDNGDGSRSTEISRTFPLPGGEWVNAPSLWMTTGGPVEVGSEDAIARLVESYERRTGEQFPRFPSRQEAETAARARSDRGGASQGSMAQPRGGGGDTGTEAGTPPGAGTESAPYKATTQAHIDWFRESAPAGAVIEVDGTLYTK